MAGGKLEIIIRMWWALRVITNDASCASFHQQYGLIWPLIMWHRPRPAVNFLLYSFELEWCLCRRWSRTCGERLLENKCSRFQESPSSTLNTADTIRASRVVHPPAGCLLPGTYQVDVFHHTVCGWISHTRIKSTFKKAPTITLHSVLLLSAFIRPALLLLLHCAWLLQSQPINTTL